MVFKSFRQKKIVTKKIKRSNISTQVQDNVPQD